MMLKHSSIKVKTNHHQQWQRCIQIFQEELLDLNLNDLRDYEHTFGAPQISLHQKPTEL